MSIKGISTYSVYFQFNEVGGMPTPGSVVKYIDQNSVEHHFVITFYSAGIKSIGIKPVSGFGKVFPGLIPSSYLYALDESFYIKIANNSVKLNDGSIIHKLYSVTDVQNSSLVTRHSLINSDSRGVTWNESFMDGSLYSYSECNLDFLSFTLPYEEEFISGISKNKPNPVIAINSKFGLVLHKDVAHYRSHPVLFLDKSLNSIVKINTIDFINMGDFAKNNLRENYTEALDEYSICVFADNDYLNAQTNFVNFANNINSFESSYNFHDLLVINSSLHAGLIRLNVSPGYTGFGEMKNYNSIQKVLSEGCFDGDYVNEFSPIDDESMVFLKYDNKTYCVGHVNYRDTTYFSGCNFINGRYVADGRNSFGEFSKSLIDSGNYCTINKIKLFFDRSFINVINAITNLYEHMTVSYEEIGIINKVIDGNVVNRNYQNYDPIQCFHQYVIGDSICSYIDGKYRFDDGCENYVPGSAYLPRDVRPITKNVNTKGLAEKSVGMHFSPQYAYMQGQYKSLAIPMFGEADLFMPFKNTIKDLYVDHNFVFVEKCDLGLAIKDRISKKQLKNLYISGISCVENDQVLSGSDGVLKYLRKDGSISNVIRHDDAAILLCLSLQFLSFLNEGEYSEKMSLMSNVIFDFGQDGRSKSVKLSFVLNSINKSIYQYSDYNDTYYVSKLDRDIAIHEMQRMVKSLRGFYGGPSSAVYQDLIGLINDYGLKYPSSTINVLKEKIIDTAHLLTKLNFYIKGLGEPQVDVFGMAEDATGIVDLESISSLSLNDKGLRKYKSNNVSKSISLYSSYKSMAYGQTSPIWSGIEIFSGSIRSPYPPNDGKNAAPIDVRNTVEVMINRWLDSVSQLSEHFDGYIVESKDHISIVDDNEMRSRNYVLIESLKNKTNVLLNSNFKIGISFSCISDVDFPTRTTGYLNSGYIINASRIFANIIKPSLDAGARIVVQDQNIDMYILSYFNFIDAAIIGNRSKEAENALCFFENVYNPDYPNKSFLLDLDGNESAVFDGIKFNTIEQNAFINYLNYQGSYYFSSYSAFKSAYSPAGAELSDSNIDLERFCERKSVLYVAQNLIAEQISTVVSSINDYEITQNTQKSLLMYGYRSAAVQAPKRITHNIFAHNFFNFVMVKMGEEVQNTHFTRNLFSSPYAGLKTNQIHAFTHDDNFVLKKIFHRSSNIKDSYIESCIVGDWGKLKNVYPIPPNEFVTSDGINMTKGEGSNNRDDDIIFRLSTSNLPNIKNYSINGII